jgi:predicted esterase
MTLLKRMLRSLLRILAGVPIVSLLGGGLLFLVFSATLKGRSVGLSAVILGGILYCSVGYWNREWFRRIRRRFVAILLPAGLVLYLVPMILAPSGGTADGRVRNCFVGGQGNFSRYSPWNVIPEADQLRVGMCLLPLGDPYVDFAQAARIRSLVLPNYREMEEDPEFCSVGSVMGMAYRELFHMEFRTGHYCIVLPETTHGEKLPCLIFLHGLGGNVKSCLWVLSRLSNRIGCVVIAPTFGMGNWDKPGSAELVVDVAREAIATLSLDPDRIFLMGYSNGAVGVTRAAVKAPGLFRGLIYLSPITEDEFFETTGFSAGRRDRTILFLHGGRDERIPRTFVEGTAGALKRRGCDVRLKVYDDDHFLLFSQQEAILSDIAAFITSPGVGS